MLRNIKQNSFYCIRKWKNRLDGVRAPRTYERIHIQVQYIFILEKNVTKQYMNFLDNRSFYIKESK